VLGGMLQVRAGIIRHVMGQFRQRRQRRGFGPESSLRLLTQKGLPEVRHVAAFLRGQGREHLGCRAGCRLGQLAVVRLRRFLERDGLSDSQARQIAHGGRRRAFHDLGLAHDDAPENQHPEHDEQDA
jgi:hypothetical protein